MGKYVFVNNELMEEEKANLHFKDLSFQRGYGVFDFFRLIDNTPLFLHDHLERFYSSAEGMHLPFHFCKQEISELVQILVKKNDMPGSGIRLGLTGGYSSDGMSIGSPNFIVSQHHFSPPSIEQAREGIQLMSYPHQRQLPRIKSIDYLMAIWLQPLQKEKQADDILYHQNGIVAECPRSNIFLVSQNDKLITPAAHILKGITRKKLMEIACKEFEVEERDVLIDELKKAKEVFITSTTKQLLPVSRIDNVRFSDRKITQYLLSLFRTSYNC